MKRFLIGALAVASLVLVLAPAAAADPPAEELLVDVFVDEDPCTGEDHEVTISVTFSVHVHEGRIVALGERTLSTSSGYLGRGTSSFVANGRVEVFRFTDVLANASDDRIRATGLFVLDVASGTVRIDDFKLTCIGA
jgi:hypothetical protein